MARGTLNHKNTPAGRHLDRIVQIHLSGSTTLLFMGHLRPDIKTEEIVDSVSAKQLCHPTCGRAGGNVYFQKPWNLSSRQDPISPAVWCSNCTVMAFYVAALRWLIIYTLHTPSPCYSNLSKLMTCSKHDGKLWASEEQILKLRKETMSNFCKSHTGSQHGSYEPGVMQVEPQYQHLILWRPQGDMLDHPTPHRFFKLPETNADV